MGKRLENWLSKASSSNTRKNWLYRWNRFTDWVTSEANPLTGRPHLECTLGEVDEVIRSDFESMPSHLFQDKYRDILSKYATSLNKLPNNSLISYVSTVRSFLTNEAASVKLPRGKLPGVEMAMNEHRFTLEEFRQMWLIGDFEDKARLSTALSLGWGVGDFLELERGFIEKALGNVDEDGFTAFDYRRKKTRARIRGILNPCAIADLKNHLKGSPKGSRLWTTTTEEGLNKWLKNLVEKAQVKPTGTIRFHLIRKYTFDVVTSQCGPYEAKLLVGKTIPLADATYLHGLEDRLLERYKKFAYPFLLLNGQRIEQTNKIDVLEEKLSKTSEVLDYLQSENLDLKNRLRRIEEQKIDEIENLQKRMVDMEQQIKNWKQLSADLEQITRYVQARKTPE